jgi:hypothetical protein
MTPHEAPVYEEDIEFIREALRQRTPHKIIRARYTALYACSHSTFARRHRVATGTMAEELCGLKEERELQAISSKPAMSYLRRRHLLQQVADGTREVEREVVVKGEVVTLVQRPTIKEQLSAVAELNRMSGSKEAEAVRRDAEFKRCLGHLPAQELHMLRQLLLKVRILEKIRNGSTITKMYDAFHNTGDGSATGHELEEEMDFGSNNEVSDLLGGQELQDVLKAASKAAGKVDRASEPEFNSIMGEIRSGGWQLVEMAHLDKVSPPQAEKEGLQDCPEDEDYAGRGDGGDEAWEEADDDEVIRKAIQQLAGRKQAKQEAPESPPPAQKKEYRDERKDLRMERF